LKLKPLSRDLRNKFQCQKLGLEGLLKRESLHSTGPDLRSQPGLQIQISKYLWTWRLLQQTMTSNQNQQKRRKDRRYEERRGVERQDQREEKSKIVSFGNGFVAVRMLKKL
jgi:hypothetical protein